MGVVGVVNWQGAWFEARKWGKWFVRLTLRHLVSESLVWHLHLPLLPLSHHSHSSHPPQHPLHLIGRESHVTITWHTHGNVQLSMCSAWRLESDFGTRQKSCEKIRKLKSRESIINSEGQNNHHQTLITPPITPTCYPTNLRWSGVGPTSSHTPTCTCPDVCVSPPGPQAEPDPDTPWTPTSVNTVYTNLWRESRPKETFCSSRRPSQPPLLSLSSSSSGWRSAKLSSAPLRLLRSSDEPVSGSVVG